MIETIFNLVTIAGYIITFVALWSLYFRAMEALKIYIKKNKEK